MNVNTFEDNFIAQYSDIVRYPYVILPEQVENIFIHKKFPEIKYPIEPVKPKLGTISDNNYYLILVVTIIVAFLIGVLFCYLMYDAFFRISALPIFSGKLDYFIQAIGVNAHYDSISRGVVDTRDIVYFLSVISLFLIASRTTIESRKW